MPYDKNARATQSWATTLYHYCPNEPHHHHDDNDVNVVAELLERKKSPNYDDDEEEAELNVIVNNGLNYNLYISVYVF